MPGDLARLGRAADDLGRECDIVRDPGRVRQLPFLAPGGVLVQLLVRCDLAILQSIATHILRLYKVSSEVWAP